MSDCEYCNLKDVDIIYEDEKLTAILAPRPATDGHIIIIPKKHYPIIEQIPDYELAYIFNIVNKIGIAAFESVGAQGTNIMIENGVAAGQLVPHVSIHIIPRKENDGLNFLWQPKQLTEEQMSTIELNLKKSSETIGTFQTEEKVAPIKLTTKAKKIKKGKGENYLIKQLERIP